MSKKDIDSNIEKKFKEILNNLGHENNVDISKFDQFLDNQMEKLDVKSEDFINENMSLIDFKEDLINNYFQNFEDADALKKKFNELK